MKRPTEIWLALWAAGVLTAKGFGIEIPGEAVAGIGSGVGILVTIAAHLLHWGPVPSED